MNPRLIAFATAAAGTFATAPLVRRLMLRNGTIDVPNHRSSHTTPVPRGGGLAALAGVASALTVTRGGIVLRDALAVVALAATGYADDCRAQTGGLRTTTRLAVQIGAGMCAADRTMLSRVAAPLIVPSVVNVVNFMDGINGISALTAIVWGANLQFGPQTPRDVQLLGALTAGVGVGFLPWNAPEAHLFLGDVGSYLLGGLMSAGIIRSLTTERPFASAARVAAPLIPYAADAAQAIVRRAVTGKPITQAHREHVYQRIVDSGQLDHVQMAATHAALAAGCALAWSRFPPASASADCVMVCALYLALPTVLPRRKAA